MSERLQTLLAHPDYMTLVAEISEQIVGIVGVFVGHALEFSGPYGRLTGIAVDSEWRGRGIGRMLMETAEDRTREKGARMLTLTSGSHRREAHSFYRALGYEETGLRFVKQL